MIQIIYNPIKLNSIINIAYCSNDEIDQDYADFIFLDHPYQNFVPIISNENKQNLFIIVLEEKTGKWIFYHANKKWNSKFAKQKILNILINAKETFNDMTEYNYRMFLNSMGCVGTINYDKIDIVQFIDGVKMVPNFFAYNKLDLKNHVLYKLSLFGHKTIPIINYSNMLVSTKTGLIELNSTSFIDLVFSTIGVSKSNDHTRELIDVLVTPEYLKNLYPTFQIFKDNFEMIQNITPKQNYKLVYDLSKNNDTDYFNLKIEFFKQEVIDTFKKFKEIYHNPDIFESEKISIFIANFINALKKDLVTELSIIYHRLRHFPTERIKLYKKYYWHPYVKLIKIIHRNYLNSGNKNNRFIGANDIYKILEQKNDLFIYNDITITLKEAIKRRSELFVFMYELYLESKAKSIKPKYKTKYNYFPFKIYSSKLFMMEHILSNQSQ